MWLTIWLTAKKGLTYVAKKQQYSIVIDESITNEYLQKLIRDLKQGNPHYPYHALKKKKLLPILEELLIWRLNLENI